MAVAAAMWATDPYFRPALTQQLTASQIVFVESLLIALCFVPVAGRIRRELHHIPLRQWIAMGIIALGAQAFATVLFTQALSYAFPAHAAPDFNVENEVYLLYMLQPVFGIAMARIFLKERRKPSFWPLAACAIVGVYLIVFPQNPLAPFSSVQHGQLLAAVLILGAVVLWASGTVFGRYSLSNVSFVTTAAMRFTLALPVLLILMLTGVGGGHLGTFSAHQIPSFIGIALVPGLLAMLLYYRALEHPGVTRIDRRARLPVHALSRVLAAGSRGSRSAAVSDRDRGRVAPHRRGDDAQPAQASRRGGDPTAFRGFPDRRRRHLVSWRRRSGSWC